MNVSPFLKQWMEEAEAERAARRELIMNLSPAYLKWKEEMINEGIQLGKQEGIQLATQSIARNLLATDMDPAQIAAVTGLTPEQIRHLQN
jgi:predicted transposase/invertase (TIGR01784 family)